MKSPKSTPSEKKMLHLRNLHRHGYDFQFLLENTPELQQFIMLNPSNWETIDFSNPDAVLMLNRALLESYYNVANWNIPPQFLCPPVPGRADYIHYIADLLAETNNGDIPTGDTVSGLDIGIGANCIYPILGNSIYGWSFVGTDSESAAIQNCVEILQANQHLAEHVTLQLQPDNRSIFKGIIQPGDLFSFSMCNPPFHSSAEEAAKGSARKNNNLKNPELSLLNFGGQGSELWYDGGEIAFITQMIFESARFPLQCLWFTTLVSKSANLNAIYKSLNRVNASQIETIEMAQGQKTSRIVAWSFLSASQRATWKF